MKQMTITERLRDVKGTAFIKLGKDVKLMVGELCHQAAATLEETSNTRDSWCAEFTAKRDECERLRAALEKATEIWRCYQNEPARAADKMATVLMLALEESK